MDKNMQRLLTNAKAKVHREWSRSAFEMLGSRIQQALLAEAVLILAASQSDDISAETVRRIVEEGWLWVIDEVEKSVG